MIPAEAVEAAAHALFEKELGRPMEVADEGLYAEDIIACREDARAALEAAAPHMLGCDDALWAEFQAATQQASTNPSEVIRGLVREWVEKEHTTRGGDK